MRRPLPESLSPEAACEVCVLDSRQDGGGVEIAGYKVLVVENEAIVALDAAARLEEMGLASIGPVSSAADAIELCESLDGEIDLALMDVQLRGPTDGVELAAQLSARWEIPSVFLTAYSDPQTLARITALEPYGYLLKPLDSAALTVTLHTALYRRAQERARAQAVREQRRLDVRYREILDHSHDGIVGVDVAQRIVVFNRGAEAIFGWPAGAVLGEPLDLLIPKASVAAHRGLVGSILEGSVVSRPMTLREVEGQRRDGSRFPAEVSISRHHVGGQVGVTAMVRDITERRRHEAQRHHAQKLETIGRLASSVAHDFNNQLVPIAGYAELLCRSLPEDDRRASDAREIRAAAERAARLTRQLLLFGRRDAAKPQLLSADAFLGELLGVLRRLVGSDISIEVALDAGSALLLMDPCFLEQILLNLVANARDAMPQGGELAIRTAVTPRSALPRTPVGPSATDYVVLSVQDTGEGIAPDDLNRICEPFFTTKVAGSGTGLGLSTVQSVVDRSQGLIDVDSELGRGTVFTVYLPVASGRAGTASGRPAFTPTPPEQPASARILIVDDDADVRRLAARVLRDAGHRTWLARTPAQARERCPEQLDLLITDLVIPEVPGDVLAAEMATRTGCAVLFMSGYGDEELARRGLGYGARAVLRKPFGARALEAAVGTCLGAAGGRAIGGE